MIASLVFLFGNHADNLSRYVPKDIEMYLHLKPNSADHISDSHRSALITHLGKNSSMSADNWGKVLSLKNSEIGIFAMNGQLFAILPKKKEIISNFSNQNIPLTTGEDAIYVPELKLTELNLTKVEWFKKARKKITFADYTLYVKDITKLNLPINYSPDSIDPPITGLGEYKDDLLKLTILGPFGQEKLSYSKPSHATIPVNYSLYLHNLNPSSLRQKADFTKDTLIYHLVNELNGAIELLLTDLSDFQLTTREKNGDLDNLQNKIKEILAQTFPSEKVKVLPDYTEAIQFIADPTNWRFVYNNQLNQYQLDSDEINLLIEKENEQITIKSANQEVPYESINVYTTLDNCSRFNVKSFAMINLFGKQGLNNLTMISKSPNKLLFCLH